MVKYVLSRVWRINAMFVRYIYVVRMNIDGPFSLLCHGVHGP